MTDREAVEPSEPTLDTPPVGNVSSRRAIIILIVSALFITGAGLYRVNHKKPNVVKKITSETLKDTELFFGLVESVRRESRVSFPIHIQTGANTVSAVELHIRYDPKLLNNVTIEPGRFFQNPTVLAQSVNSDTGVALLIIGTLSPRRGDGVIAIFHATTAATLSSAMTLSFDPATQVAALGENETVVKSTTDATIPIAP